MKISFVYGQTLAFADLRANSIALDGAVQGPQADPATRRFSFDHHAGCLRLVTLATCQQVLVALQLGLVVDDETEVIINDLDADTVLAVWLLQNPESAAASNVQSLVAAIGATDAHGPIFPPHPLHRELGPAYGSKEPQTLAMLEGFLAKVDAYNRGLWQAPKPRAETLSGGHGWHPNKGWEHVEVAGFQGLYAAGYLAGVLYTDASSRTRQYTVAKRSDLVPLELGPASRLRPPMAITDYMPTILGRLAVAELRANPSQTHAANWGGASSIGGSPRNPDGSSSILAPVEVLAICVAVTSGL